MRHSFLRVVALAAGLLLVNSSAALAQERVAIHGSALTAPPGIAELLDPFRGQLDSAEVAATLERRQRLAGFPRNAEEHVLASRLWWRAGHYTRALRELDELRAAEVSPLTRLERARILLQVDSARTVGVEAWWEACRTIDEPTRAEVAWDIRPLTTPEEREEWRELETGAPTCDWLRDFWSERAQRMAIPADERLALHYRRLAHAREWYWIPRERFLIGPTDFHGRPEGLAIDDRGLIYVRMGSPLANERFSADANGESGAPPFAGGARSGERGGGETSRCWPYWRSGGYRIFCFAQHPSRANADYRLTETVAGTPGTEFFQKYVVNSNLPETVIRHRVRTPALPGGGLSEPWEKALDRVEGRAWERHGVVRTRENIEEALEEIPDAPEVRATVRLRVESLRFLNPASGQWQVWVLATVRAGDLRSNTSGDGSPRVGVDGRYSTLRASEVEVRNFAPARVRLREVGEDAGITLKDVFPAASGQVPLTVVVEDQNAPKAGNWFRDTINVPSVGGLPQLSDIAVARAEGGTWTRDGRTFLKITPSHITNPDGSIHTYFEVYGVNRGTQYDVELRLVPTEEAERVWRLEPDDLGFRLQFTSEMSGEIGRHHLRLDLGDTESGEYALAVRIQDEETEAYSLPSVTEILVAEGDR